jgi:decaprenyl-phosphate phosphoribosyltransferase
VTLSRWFIVVVTCVALFVAAGKRQSELRRTLRRGSVGRRVLSLYTEARLRLLLVGSAACALFAYCVWAFELPLVEGFPWRPLTAIPFAICLVRYGALLRAGDGEAPEDIVLRDRQLQLVGAVWLILFALSVHAAG